jgi:hypothetical protein
MGIVSKEALMMFYICSAIFSEPFETCVVQCIINRHVLVECRAWLSCAFRAPLTVGCLPHHLLMSSCMTVLQPSQVGCRILHHLTSCIELFAV